LEAEERVGAEVFIFLTVLIVFGALAVPATLGLVALPPLALDLATF